MLVALCFALHLTIPASIHSTFGYKINFRKKKALQRILVILSTPQKGSGSVKTSLEVIAPRIRRIRRTRLNRLNSHRIKSLSLIQAMSNRAGIRVRRKVPSPEQLTCNRARHKYKLKTRNHILLTSNRTDTGTGPGHATAYC